MTEEQKNNKKKTMIADDVEVVGTIKCSSDVELQGRLNGDLNCAGSALIGKSANVKGNISVESTTVEGQVNGNITAKDKVELKSSAKVTGDVRAKRMTVEDGVTFVGKSEVNASGARSTIHEISPSEESVVAEDDEKVRAMKDEIRKNVKEDVKNKSGGFFGKK